jgi:hypothetical protein
MSIGCQQRAYRETSQVCCGGSDGNNSPIVQCSRRQSCSSKSRPTFCSPISIRWREDLDTPSCPAGSVRWGGGGHRLCGTAPCSSPPRSRVSAQDAAMDIFDHTQHASDRCLHWRSPSPERLVLPICGTRCMLPRASGGHHVVLTLRLVVGILQECASVPIASPALETDAKPCRPSPGQAQLSMVQDGSKWMKQRSVTPLLSRRALPAWDSRA